MATIIKIFKILWVIFDVNDLVLSVTRFRTRFIGACDILHPGQGRIVFDMPRHELLIRVVIRMDRLFNDAFGSHRKICNGREVEIFSGVYEFISRLVLRQVQHVLAIIAKLHPCYFYTIQSL